MTHEQAPVGRLDGKSAVVVGAARGIGRETAETMAAEGARLLLGDLDGNAVTEVAGHIRDNGGEALAMTVDITQEDDVKRMIERAVSEYGTINVLHQNAAILEPSHLAQDLNAFDTPESVFRKTFEVNLFGTISCCRNVIPVMIANGGGSIVLTGSMAGLVGYPALNAYAASKAALLKLTRDIATAFGRHGIRCNMIAPGQIVTELVRQARGPEGIDVMIRVAPIAAQGEPSDIANAAVFFASDESKFITGHVMPVDGGAYIHSPDVEYGSASDASHISGAGAGSHPTQQGLTTAG